MGERFSGYMRDRITEKIKADVKADIAARPPVGNMFSDSEDSDDLVLARLSPEPRHLPMTDDVATAKAKAEKQLSSVRDSLHVIEGGKPAYEEPAEIPSSPQEKTG